MEFQKRVEQSVEHYIEGKAEIRSYQRGKAYFAQNRVKSWEKGISESDMAFVVLGTMPYKVEIQFTEAERAQIRSSHCECIAAMDGVCKHQIAALLWYAENCEALRNSDKAIVKGENLPAARFMENNRAKSRVLPETLTEEKRSANQFYTVVSWRDGVEHLRPNTDTSKKRVDYEGAIKDVTKVGKGAFTINFRLQREHWFGSLYNYTIRIKYGKSGVEVACSCGEKVQQICGHVFNALMQAHTEGLLEKWEPWSNAKMDKNGLDEMHKYGFDAALNWREYFEFKETEAGHIFHLLPAYQNYLSPSRLNTNFISSIEMLDAENELSVIGHLNEKKENPYELGFAFIIDARDADYPVKLVPICGKPNKKGIPMSQSFVLRDRISSTAECLYGRDDFEILHAIHESTLNAMGYGRSKMTGMAAMAAIADKLERHPFVLLSDGRLGGAIRRNSIEPAKFVTGLPNWCIEIVEFADHYEIRAVVPSDFGYKPLEKDKINSIHPHFLVEGNEVRYIESVRHWSAVVSVLELDQLRFTHQNFHGIFEGLLVKLSAHFELKFPDMKRLKISEQPILQPMAKELYLSEVGSFVIFEPFVRYAEDVLLPAGQQGQRWQMNNAQLQSQNIDNHAGQELLNVLKMAHPSFQDQRRSDFFHLSYKELLQKDVAQNLFFKFNDADIKIFGEKNLTRLKELPKTAKVNYSVKSKIDWFEIEAQFHYGEEMLTLAVLKKRFVPGQNYVELGNGGRGLIPEMWLKKLERLFKMGEINSEKLLVSSMHFNLIDELFDELEQPDLQSFIAERRDKLMHFKGIETHPLPRGIKATLRPYQTDGFQWLCFLHEFGWGGILADDMGLGKTLQAITFLKHLLKTNKQTNLVVVPTSLLFNWENELQKFAPGIKSHIHHGIGRSSDKKQLQAAQLVVTSYGTLLSDIELLRHIDFNYVVLDESQAIKNTASKRYKAVRLLKANNRLAMTGTPIENNTFDLYAQLSFLNPGLLGSAAQFKADFAKAIDTHRDADKAAMLQRMIKPFVLRRTKEQVAKELPDKVEDVLYCELGAAQRKIYDAHRNEIRETLLGNMESEAISNVRFAVLQGLTKLRQICDSPLLLPGKDKYVGGSEKIDLLVRHIREKTANHKLLIFSQFVKMLKLIEERIVSEDIPYAYLDGQSTTKARQEAVETFQTDSNCRVFLISLKAGGTGLNLMAADYVYIVDPWWNPAVENQAIDRCYRIGQDKKVIAYRLICKDTVEEKIQKLQARKKSIANDLITTDEGVMQKLSKDDLVELFG